MTSEEAQWEKMIAGLRVGDEEVATDFYARYGPLLENLAASHLATGVLRRVGPDDVANSACRTFLRRIQGGQFTIGARDSLWNLLCAITLAKARKKARFHLARKRAVVRDAQPATADDESPVARVPGGGPSPEEAAAFADQFRHLLGRLDDEERQIVLLKLEQRTQEEIAAARAISERTVRRILRRVEERLSDLLASGD
ncbi:MAG: sigma-70 family RNA polymerase sigma factor [Planctomycetes bacterium]|nr:sigma-70 family RNA polymerase sigma factor [Planctomycetota bacterium]